MAKVFENPVVEGVGLCEEPEEVVEEYLYLVRGFPFGFKVPAHQEPLEQLIKLGKRPRLLAPAPDKGESSQLHRVCLAVYSSPDALNVRDLNHVFPEAGLR